MYEFEFAFIHKVIYLLCMFLVVKAIYDLSFHINRIIKFNDLSICPYLLLPCAKSAFNFEFSYSLDVRQKIKH